MAMYGIPVLILKEGSQRTVGREALRANIMAARALAEVLKTSLGPRGLDKMLVDSFGDVTVTNDGATIVKEMEVQHPAAKLLVEVAKAQDAEVGDGTTSAVVLAGALLRKAEELLDQNIHPTIIIEGYTKALKEALRILDEIALKVDPSDRETLKKVVTTTIASKYIGGPLVSEKLTNMAIDAALTVAEKKPDGIYEFRVDDVKIEKKKGGNVLDTQLVYGIVLDKEVVHPGMPRRVENAKIALLDAALEVEKPEITAKINITSPELMNAFIEEEARILRDMVEKIASTGANVVITQKGIDEVAQHFLAKKGILAVRRVKRSDLEKLERATGGKIVSSVRDLKPEDLGYAALVEERRVGNDKMVFVEGCKNPKAVTILVRGASDMVLDEIERSLKDALNVLRNVLRVPKIVPGGGATEIAVALKLRDYAAKIGGKEQLAIEAFASALEEIPLILAETAGLDPLETLMKLRQYHSEGKVNAGIDVINGVVREDMSSISVVEPLLVKNSMIKTAAEAAVTILKIDDIIAASPLKKEEKKEKKEEEETSPGKTSF
ncbi:Thermosome subunit alpha [Thermogladius calderae 1633]|uniref:T-complex protein 1 subunit alpha n=1 Tax=Thermogladius calderae (strain DSM 22663 / VKM B-2946 / 1633) TaxID=1184251 RepID=I3TCI2_THEC1|nr:thermosome subunit alpha [Thermogladius calderae]AFK50470.1 Thermosome subunit alpha [Thermogladius calderae 1633]